MAHRSLWLFAIALLAGIAILLGRSCAGEDASIVDAVPSPTATAIVPDGNAAHADAGQEVKQA